MIAILAEREINAMERRYCFACDRPLKAGGYLVGCQDDQTVYVGALCLSQIKNAGKKGYQPPKGGPRLFLLAYTKHKSALGSDG